MHQCPSLCSEQNRKKKKKNYIEEYYSQGKETANEKVKTINKIDGDKYIEEIPCIF